jgi:Fibronectin type III domain
MSFLSGDVKVPGISKPLPKAAVFGGLALTGVLIVVYYRDHKASSASSAAAEPASGALGADSGLNTDLGPDSGDAYPWDGSYGNSTDPYSLDPSSGQTYGDESGGAFYSSPGSSSGGGAAGPPFSNNQQWSAYAIQQLTNDGKNAGNVTTALGLYLSGKVLDADEQSIVYAAIGVAGAVPVSASDGYPPKIRTAGDGHKGGTSFAVNPVKGLKATGGARSLKVSWDKSDHATSYQVSVKNASGNTGPKTATTSGLTHTFTGLAAGTEYKVTVLARPAEKGAHAAETSARTTAAKGK